MTAKHALRRRERIEAPRCRRLQCRFCTCFLAVVCVCVFVACIYTMPASLVPSALLQRSATFLSPASHGLLYLGSQEKRATLHASASRSIRSRKLLASDTEYAEAQYSPATAPAPVAGGHTRNGTRNQFQVQRMGPGAGERSTCSIEDIAIVQGEMGPLPDGIPSFAVQILNLCLEGCPIADIHVSCGWFASATLVNPALFKRVGFDDCLVKGGHALAAGETLTFQYANSFQYPFSLSSASFTCP
ncbi:hypothetical protein GOP47_0025945 [Adiantum capillus-veneris]|uniref:Uncharacterized protein n=1 Tax=Adiantum capillus-veneris TaxID=13818 RepID=A0A9D4U3R8_ADICA|nr:hypothetical protein GOP47_0025945 [Adiantum capillus-veneris]